MNRAQKWVNVILWGLIIILGIYILSHGYSMMKETSFNPKKVNILDKLYVSLDKLVLETYMPGLSYPLKQDNNSESLEAYVTEKVFESAPLYSYLKSTLGYQTEIENSSTIAKIVYAEGMDEEKPEDPTDVGTEMVTVETSAENTVTPISGDLAAEVAAENAAAAAGTAENGTVNEAEEAASSAIGFAKLQDISMEKLADFDYLLRSFYIVDNMTTVTSDELNASQLLADDLTIQKDSSVPQILIFHTHSQEEFVDSIPGDPSTSIVGVGEYLAQLLREQYGYNVIHDTGVYDLIDGVLDRDKAYTVSGEAAAQILAENPSIQVVIDLHRDGTNDKVVADYNGKPTARFMFFNGLSKSAKNGPIDYLANPYIQDNLAFSFQMQLKSAQYFPGISRGIYLRGLRYNMHLMPRMLLIESGSQLNTVQEQLNAMDIIAELLDQVLSGR